MFISYRRDDTGEVVDRLEPALRDALPKLRIFRDTGGIAPADNYLKVLQSEIERAWIFLAVIGGRWLGPVGARMKIDDPEDILRREVEWRLHRADSPYSATILPILVEGAVMPKEADLPPRMRKVAQINATRLRLSTFDSDVGALADRIDVLVKRARAGYAKLCEETTELARRIVGEGIQVENTAQDSAGVGVFSKVGRWQVTIASRAAPDPIAGPRGRAELDFTIGDDNAMRGTYRVLSGKTLFGSDKHVTRGIEGEALLLMGNYSAGIVNNMLLHGVIEGVEQLILYIPIERKAGPIYIGTDRDGRQYALKLISGGDGRVGF